MPLARRSSQRVQGSIWPGFVDAMTGLLLVLMFVLTIFMVVQFVLRETITGQESKLDALAQEVSALATALGLEERESSQLEARLGALNTTLNTTQTDLESARAQIGEQSSIIASLTAERDQQSDALQAAQSQITGFEAQIAALIADRDSVRETLTDLQAQKSDLEAAQDILLSEQEALNLALAQSRTEVDAQIELARLAAARREALEALVTSLEKSGAEQNTAIENLEQRLSDEEAARLVEAAAAETLRAQLKDSDAELTAMTLALEAQRKEAEDTLTLLAASDVAEQQLKERLQDLLLQVETAESQVRDRDEVAERLTRVLAQMEAAQDAAEQKLAALEAELTRVQGESGAAQENLTGQLAALQVEADQLRRELDIARAANAESEQGRLSVEERLLAALEQLETAQAAASDNDVLRSRLAAALAAQQAAESNAQDRLSDADQRALLLAQAREALSAEQEISAEAQRQAALLNQQVAALRTQLGALQALLDDYKERDAVARVQLESLGQDLNAALARAASEERKRRLLEQAERIRLEQEAIDLAAKAKALEEEAKNLENYRSEFFGRVREILGDQEGVRIEGDRFVFSSEVLFDPGSAELSVLGAIEIAKVSRILREIAREIPPEINWVIRVDGHTDNVPLNGLGKYADNWELSQGRALSVVRYMVEFLGIPPDRLAANGFGEYQPLDTDDTTEARAQNRRIELKLTEK
ncbi:MAG: peptidoglycan -binding protein [Paracoccaceae bacterium]